MKVNSLKNSYSKGLPKWQLSIQEVFLGTLGVTTNQTQGAATISNWVKSVLSQTNRRKLLPSTSKASSSTKINHVICVLDLISYFMLFHFYSYFHICRRNSPTNSPSDVMSSVWQLSHDVATYEMEEVRKLACWPNQKVKWMNDLASQCW